MDKNAKNKKDETIKYRASDLVIIPKGQLGVLNANPIDNLDLAVYERLEKLTSWFVLRAPLTEITKLANPGSIAIFSSNKEPARGSRTVNRLEFEKSFLDPFGIDCTKFEFVYGRIKVKPSFSECDLDSNDDDVFDVTDERCVCFVGKHDSSREDSCIESICRHIRNAFAHGRLAIREIDGEPYIFMEDGSSPRHVDYGVDAKKGQKLEVRFRMVVKLATLESWHEVLVGNA